MPEDAYGWLRDAVSEFGRQCRRKLSGGGGQESSIRAPLEILLKSVGEHAISGASGPVRVSDG
jgi:hypothetical protein